MQLIEEWEKSVNSYSQDYTEEYELFISGSNSRMLSGELATLGDTANFRYIPSAIRSIQR